MEFQEFMFHFKILEIFNKNLKKTTFLRTPGNFFELFDLFVLGIEIDILILHKEIFVALL